MISMKYSGYLHSHQNLKMTSSSTHEKKKDIALEAIRGIAALSVLLWHCCLGFLPEYVGVVTKHDGISSWQGSPFFFLINGTAAVSLFFVLSGYILTRRYFLSGDTKLLARGALKRWPRLMGPVLLTVLVSYLFFKFGWYFFQKAGPIANTPFLAKFVWNAETPFPISFCGALLQSSFFTFFRGDSFYNSSLWTMQLELIGSFVVFGMAPMIWEAKKISTSAVLFLTGCIILIAHFTKPDLVAFPVGVAMAALLPRNKGFSVNFITILLLLIALYLLGTSSKRIGIYQPINWIDPSQKMTTYFYIFGAALLIGLIKVVPAWHHFLSGSFWKWLGEFSFPIYLIHIVVICSLGCLVYLHYGRASAIAVSLLATPFAALPLLFFNRFWVSQLNQITNQLFHRKKEVP